MSKISRTSLSGSVASRRKGTGVRRLDTVDWNELEQRHYAMAGLGPSENSGGVVPGPETH